MEEEEETRGKLPFVVTEKQHKSAVLREFVLRVFTQGESVSEVQLLSTKPNEEEEEERRFPGSGGGPKKKEMARYKIAQIEAKLNRSKSSQNAILYIFLLFFDTEEKVVEFHTD